MPLSLDRNLLPSPQLSLINMTEHDPRHDLIPSRTTIFDQFITLWKIEIRAVGVVNGYALQIPRGGDAHRGPWQ